MISTVAATALYQQVPFVSSGLFLMGFSYQVVGTAHYIMQALALRRVIGLKRRVISWYIFHSLSACFVWSLTIAFYAQEKRPEWFDALKDIIDEFVQGPDPQEVNDDEIDVHHLFRSIRRDLVAERHHLELVRSAGWYSFLKKPSARELQIVNDLAAIDEVLADEVDLLSSNVQSNIGLTLQQALLRHKKSLEAASKVKHNTTNAKKLTKALSDLKRCQDFIAEIQATSEDIRSKPYNTG